MRRGLTRDGGQVIFGSNYTVESGDTFEGDLVVFGGNVTIEEDASLNGNLVVIGGTITSNGEMEGDVVVVGGQISLEESAVVAGDVVTIGGQLEQAEGATIEGEVVNNVAPDIVLPNGRIPPDSTWCSRSCQISQARTSISTSIRLQKSSGSSSGRSLSRLFDVALAFLAATDRAYRKRDYYAALDDRCHRVAGILYWRHPLPDRYSAPHCCLRLVVWCCGNGLGSR